MALSFRTLRCIAGLSTALAAGSAILALPVQADTILVPALSIAERYDSNVFFIGTGGNLEDYVTTVTPQLTMEHRGRLVDSTATVLLTGERYIRNPGLSYIFPSGTLNLNLDRLVGQISQRLKLSVSDNFTYTPRPPAFVAPGAGPTAPDFVRGIQAVRANSLFNIATINAAYLLSPVASLTSSYRHQLMRFGTAFAPVPGQGFFTTEFQTFTLGPEIRITPRDTASVTFNYSNIHFSQGDAFEATFEITGGTVGWRRELTPTIALSGTAGLSVFEPLSSVQYVGSASFEWKERNTTTILSYTRSVFPSFFIAAAPLVSNVLSLSVVHQMTETLSLLGALNYAKNESVSPPPLDFTSYGASVSLNYALTRSTSVSASYAYNQFEATFGVGRYSFDRNVATISLRTEWR